MFAVETIGTLVKSDQRTKGCLFTTRANEMSDIHLRIIDHAPALFVYAPTQVGIFPIQEKLLIQFSNFLNGLAPNEEDGERLRSTLFPFISSFLFSCLSFPLIAIRVPAHKDKRDPHISFFCVHPNSWMPLPKSNPKARTERPSAATTLSGCQAERVTCLR